MIALNLWARPSCYFLKFLPISAEMHYGSQCCKINKLSPWNSAGFKANFKGWKEWEKLLLVKNPSLLDWDWWAEIIGSKWENQKGIGNREHWITPTALRKSPRMQWMLPRGALCHIHAWTKEQKKAQSCRESLSSAHPASSFWNGGWPSWPDPERDWQGSLRTLWGHGWRVCRGAIAGKSAARISIRDSGKGERWAATWYTTGGGVPTSWPDGSGEGSSLPTEQGQCKLSSLYYHLTWRGASRGSLRGSFQPTVSEVPSSYPGEAVADKVKIILMLGPITYRTTGTCSGAEGGKESI